MYKYVHGSRRVFCLSIIQHNVALWQASFSQDLPFDRRERLLVLTTVRSISDKKKKKERKKEGKKIGIPNHDMRIGKQNEKWSN